MSRLLAALAFSFLAAGAANAQQTIAITGGRIVTNGPQGTIERGVVLIQGERIIAVGTNVTVPPESVMIDAEGKWVTPGLFSAYAEAGIVEIDAETSTDDRAANALSPFSIALEAARDFNPNASNVAVARGDGITRLGLAPSSEAGLFAGEGAVADTSGSELSITRAPAFISASLTAGRLDLVGGSRAAAYAYLEAALDDADAFPNLAEENRGDVLNGRDAEALQAVVRGDIPLLVEADRASDMLQLADLVDRYEGMRLVIVGGAESHLVADRLAAAGIAVILDPSQNLPYTFDMVAATARTAAVLDAAGVVFAIVTFGDAYANPGYLAQNAGIAVAHGLTWDAAFDSITWAPAHIFGVDADLGSIEPGKLADVVIWDGDPLEVMSGAERVYIAGTEYSPRNRQSDLRDRYLEPVGADDLPQAYRRP